MPASPPLRTSLPPLLTPTTTALAANKLGTGALLLFALCAATPLTVVAGVITVGFAQTATIGMPLAFLVVGAILMIFTTGFVAMGRHLGRVGGLYAYVTHGLSGVFGVGAAWVALIAYNALTVGLYGGIGAAAAPLLQLLSGVSPPWWLIALVCWSLAAALGVSSIRTSRGVLAVLLLAEISVLLVYDVADLAHPAGGQISMVALSPVTLIGVGLGANLVLAFLGFVGIEAVTAYAREAKDPRKSIPRAMRWSIGLIALLYALSGWAMTVAVGTGRIVVVAREDGIQLIFNLAGDHLGQVLMYAGLVLVCTSIVAAVVSLHNTTARYFFALGLEGVLPAWLGRTWRRTSAPVPASLTQSAIGLVVIITYAVQGWDPEVKLFYWFGSVGAVGVLTLLVLAAFAVPCFFLKGRRGEARWRAHWLPWFAAGLMVVMEWLVVANLPVLFGVAADHPLVAAVRIGYGAALGGGMLYGWYLKANRHEVYEAIGRATETTTTTTSEPPAGAHSRGQRAVTR